ncbi:hypothetical protein JCM8097_003528 [Rhodosporidiobolus ruineniae]
MAAVSPLPRLPTPESVPPSPPPPPSPAGPTPVPSRPSLRNPVFDLQSSSPASFTGADKTVLKSQLDRARRTRVLLREGVPARVLTAAEEARVLKEEREGEWSTASASSGTRVGTDVEQGGVGSEGWVTEEEGGAAKRESVVEGKKREEADFLPREGMVQAAAGPARRLPVLAAIDASLPSPSPQGWPANDPLPTPSRGRLSPSTSARTAPSSRTGSPTSRLTLLLSSPRAKAPPATPLTSPTTATSLSSPFSSRPTAHPAAARDSQPLTAAVAAADTTPRPSRYQQQAMYPFPPSAAPTRPSSSALPLKKPLVRIKTLPAAPPPSPATASPASAASESPPAPPIPRIYGSASFPSPAPNRFLSASRLSSPNVSPPLPPLRSPHSPVMSARDPRDLTLNFARRPDVLRKVSYGESQRGLARAAAGEGVRRRSSTTSDGKRRTAPRSWEGSEADTEVTDTEVEGEEEEVLEHFEPSVFASPRSNSAASLSSASSTFIRSRAASTAPTGSAASSVQSSPKITSASLSAAFSSPFPSPLLPPAVAPVPGPLRRAATETMIATRPKHIDLREFRLQQQARRLEAQAEANDETFSSSSPSSAAEETTARKLQPSGLVGGMPSPPPTPTPMQPNLPQPRWAKTIAGSGAASLVATKTGESVVFRTMDPRVATPAPAARGAGMKRFFSRS